MQADTPPTSAQLTETALDLYKALKDIVPRFRSCIIHSGSDPVYADAAVADANAALVRAERA